jgi:hypothetical protein
MGVGGEAAVDRDRAWRILRAPALNTGYVRVLRRRRLEGDSEEDDAQRCRTPLAQCAVSVSASRV